MKNLVTRKWLQENLDNLILIDCRFDMMNPTWGRKIYLGSRIPGAFYMDLDEDLADKVSIHGGRHPLPDLNLFAQKLEKMGISNDSTVVIYDEGDLSVAARLWWMMKYIGLENVKLLEGGFYHWNSEGMPLEIELEEKTISRGKIEVTIKDKMICDVEYVKAIMNDNTKIIIDSRTIERYRGEVEPIDKIAGHIPNAKCYLWSENLDNGIFKDMEYLKDRFKELKNYEEVIVHCGSGVTAPVNIVALDEIGISSILYLGSWSDWISYDENPVAKG